MPKSNKKPKKSLKHKASKKPAKTAYSKFKDLRKSKSETVYRSSPKPPKPKGRPFYRGFITWFTGLSFKRVILFVLVFGLLILSVFLLNLYKQHKQDQQFHDEILRQTNLELSEINAKKHLIGTKEDLKNEIINYQSAPQELRDYVLKDYYVFKSKCIVNGEFVGPTSYELAAVVYDNYAKILMNCEGEDSQIVARVGGNWAVVHAGNAAPDCNDVNSLAIPMGIAATCTDGRVLYPNPNP